VPAPPRVVHLSELESIPGPGSLIWHPVRAALGIHAFGANAYTATQAGQDVVEPHRENPEAAHEELYFVAAGHATFTIDGEPHDAPSGTYVFVPDPSSHRHAVAAAPNTTVLTFGGPPTFTPSSWEWAFRAGPLIRSDPERARAILSEGIELYPRAGDLRYNLACLEAVSGDHDAALAGDPRFNALLAR
jgi:quercetin dioxygenase-like cupin family protein